MTFGGTAANPEYDRPRPQAPVREEEFGWQEREPSAPPASLGPEEQQGFSAPPASTAFASDGWEPEGTGSAGGGASFVGGDSIGKESELLMEDDARWRGAPQAPRNDVAGAPGGLARTAAEEAILVKKVEGWLSAALEQPGPSTLVRAIRAGGCSALNGGFRCVLCDKKGPRLNGVNAYYRAQTGRVLLCADRLKSQEEVTAALGHELVHAYDHCRKGMRIPGVRTQIPWALDCPTEACTEVRAYSLATYGDAPSWADKRSLVFESALKSLLSNAGSECGRAAGPDALSRVHACRDALQHAFERCAADASPFNDEGRAAERAGRFPKMPTDSS